MKNQLLTALIFFVSLCIFNASCTKEAKGLKTADFPKCQEGIINLGTIDLEDSSLEYFPYPYDRTKIIYKNQDGQEATFTPITNGIQETYSDREFELSCPGGSSNQYFFECQYNLMGHSCERLNLRSILQINPKASLNYPVFGDEITAILRSNDQSFQSIFYSQMIDFKGYDLDQDDYRTFFEFTRKYYDNITLNEKDFQEVSYVTKSGQDALKRLYYNKEFGILAFSDTEEMLWVFDRYEEN